jgi:hypothetical protein
MEWRIEFRSRGIVRICIGGEVWERKGRLSYPESERLARQIVTTNGAAWVLERWGFERVQKRGRRAA